MKHELWYEVITRDRDGKVISRERRRSRSFLKQWNQLIYTHVSTNALSINNTDGILRSISDNQVNFRAKAGAGDTTHGIRVGTGNTPVAIDDYALETPIAEGTGVDEMNHLICTIATSVVAAPSCSFLVSRSAVNNSGAEITVREAGIYVYMTTSWKGCMTRDVFGTPQAVPIGGTITVNWTLQVTV